MGKSPDFADLLWLFSSGKENRGLIRLNLAEAGLLWKYARQAKVGIVEIGRRFGGSACLLAAANPRVPIVSVDVDPLDEGPCREFLFRQNTFTNVALVNGDSRYLNMWRKPDSVDLLFIDGDHSYEGVSTDYANLKGALVPGAVLLFHDAVAGADGSQEGVIRFVGERVADGELEIIESAESMVATRFLK